VYELVKVVEKEWGQFDIELAVVVVVVVEAKVELVVVQFGRMVVQKYVFLKAGLVM
jgi:hypothetical protein